MFIIRNVFIILLSAILFSCNNQENHSSQGEFSEGKEYYLKLCASCHGKKGNLKLSKAADLSVSLITKEEIFEIIKSGKGTMPSFSRFLNEDQMYKVAEYCLALRKKE
jgi:mono/diheme cytochrome c family protein